MEELLSPPIPYKKAFLIYPFALDICEKKLWREEVISSRHSFFSLIHHHQILHRHQNHLHHHLPSPRRAHPNLALLHGNHPTRSRGAAHPAHRGRTCPTWTPLVVL